MAAVVQAWSAPGLWARLAIVILTGGAWATSSLILAILHPDYWDPIAAIDYFAVYAYTTAWLLTAASLLILRDLTRPGRAGSLIFLVVAAAYAIAGIANAAEDGLGLQGLGAVYVAGALIGGLGMVVVGVVAWASAARVRWFVPALGGIAMFGVTTALGAIALVPRLGLGLLILRERSTSQATVRPTARRAT